MKSADDLRARLGSNMKESMGRPAGAAGPLPAAGVFHGETEKYQGASRVKDALAIEVGRIAPDPSQPRKEFEPGPLAELAASLKARGQLQPIRVRWDEPMGRWIIIAGERRYRAALLAGLPTLMCVEARGPQTADEVLEDQLVENCLREDLKPVEQAHAFRALLDRRGWSYRQLGESLHIAPASIARALALLELAPEIQERVTAGEVAPSLAAELPRLGGHDAQREALAEIRAGGLTRDEAVEVIRRKSGAARPAGGKGRGAKPRKVTSRVLRAANGYRFTVECRRGLDDAGLRAALADLVAQLDAGAAEGRGEAA